MNYNNEIDNLEKFFGLSKTDLTTIAFAALLIIFGSWNLVNFQDNIESIDNLKAIAKITTITDNPQRRVSGTLSWGQVKRRDELYKGDEILTDGNSQAEIEFLNKTKLTVPANSLVKIDVDDDTFNIDVIKGIVDLDVKKANQKIVLKTKTKEYTINTNKKTKFSIKSDGDELDIQSQKGAIKLTKKIKKKVNIKAKPINEVIKQDLLSIIEPRVSARYVPNNTSSFTINLASLRNLSNVTASIIEPSLGKEPLQTINLEKTKTAIALPLPGQYELEVRANSKEKNLIKKIAFTVSEYQAPKFIEETFPNQVTLQARDKINIDWDGLNTLEYLIELKRGDKVNQIKANASQISLKPKRDGAYKVRVKVNEESAPWSAYKDMQVSFDKVLRVAGADNPSVFNLHETGSVVKLSFNNLSKEVVTVNIYSDQEKTKKVYSQETKENEIDWTPKYIGDYYWQVDSISNDEDALEKKQSTELTLVTIRNIIARTKGLNSTSMTVESDTPKVNLKWKRTYRKDRYVLNIMSKNKKVLAKKNVSGGSASITFPKAGEFLWSIEPRDNKKYFDSSSILPLSLSLPDKPETPTVPVKQVIRYKGIQKREAYRIKFDPIANATRYEIEIYSDSELTNRLVAAKSRKNFVYWVSKREGKFYFKMRYTDKWGRKSDFSNVGQIVFPISPLVR